MPIFDPAIDTPRLIATPPSFPETEAYNTRLRTMLAATSEGIVLQANSGAILSLNEAASHILQLDLSPDHLARQTCLFSPAWHIVHEDNTPFDPADYPFRRTLQTGQPCPNVIMGIDRPESASRLWLVVNSKPLYDNNSHNSEAAQALPYAVVTTFSDITQQKVAEQTLAQAYHLYHALFEQAHDAVVLIDLTGQIFQANQRTTALLGYSVAELTQRHIKQISAELEQTEQAWAQLLAGVYLPPYERMLRHRDGYLIPVEIGIELVRDITGQPLHIQAVMRDIRERKQAEAQLRESEGLYRSMFEKNQAVKLLINPATGEILDANSSAAEFYGYDQEILRQMRIQQINTLTPQEVQAEMALARAEKRRLFHFRHRLASGEIRDVDVFSGPVQLQGMELLYSIILDVTAQKQAEQALRESEARQRALLRAIPDLVFRNARDGMYLDYHASNVADLLLPPEAFLGKTMREVLPPELGEKLTAAIPEVLETGKEVRHEYSLLIGGEKLSFEARMVAAGEDEVLTMVRNVTEQRLVQERAFAFALEKARIQLLREFIEAASHEFRTPLTVINANAYLLARLEDGYKRQAKIEGIQLQVKRLTRLVDMLLLMTLLETQGVTEVSSVDVLLVVGQVLQELEEKYETRPCLHQHTAPNLPLIQANFDYLSQACLQILDNAYRFTPAEGNIYLDIVPADNGVIVQVRDTGVGIAAVNLPHVFEPFWRQDKAHTTPGLGLGLVIAEKIVGLHHGRVTLTSTQGQGTTVTIWLPQTPPS
jgi:PAS domain S-box-containing protein